MIEKLRNNTLIKLLVFILCLPLPVVIGFSLLSSNLLVGLFYLVVLFCIGYLVIKRAVKEGIIEAHEELKKQER